MQRLLRSPYALLASFALLLGACNKSTPTPDPVLEGSWNITSLLTKNYSPPATQPTQYTATYPVDNSVNAYYVTFTSTTFQGFYPSSGQASGLLEFYTRSGNTLSFSALLSGNTTPTPTRTNTIVQLTATDLTLFSTQKAPSPSSDYTTYEAHYTRR